MMTRYTVVIKKGEAPKFMEHPLGEYVKYDHVLRMMDEAAERFKRVVPLKSPTKSSLDQ